MVTSAITGITSDPTQKFSLPLDDGTSVNITLFYVPNQMGWFYNLSWNGNTKYPAIIINGRRVVTSPNMLRQYQNEIPFGFGCVTQDGYEPLNQNCFINQYATLFLLDYAAVTATELQFYPGI
jgi:hypothetical protein